MAYLISLLYSNHLAPLNHNPHPRLLQEAGAVTLTFGIYLTNRLTRLPKYAKI